MPKSIQTPQATVTTAFTVPHFTAGDTVLCPSAGNGSYPLYHCDELDKLYIIDNHTAKLYYRHDGRTLSDDPLLEIFHDTPANRQAISTLYNISYEGLDQPQPSNHSLEPLSEMEIESKAFHGLSKNKVNIATTDNDNKANPLDKLARDGIDFAIISQTYTDKIHALNHAISYLATIEPMNCRKIETIKVLNGLSDFLNDMLDGETSHHKQQCEQIFIKNSPAHSSPGCQSLNVKGDA